MRVGLDGRTLAATTRTGVEHYVIHLVRALSRLDDAPEIIAYTDRPIPDPDLAEAASSGPVRTVCVRARRGWLRAALPWRLWRDGVDLVHLPSTILPPLLPCPAVVTVHDLAWTRYPETYEPRDLVMQGLAVARAVSRAAHIICVSESTARDLGERYPESRDRITAIPLGVSPEFSLTGRALSPSAFAGADRLSEGYLLYTGGLRPRKNLMRLLEAYRQVSSSLSPPPLVLAGARTPHADELAAEAQRLGLQGRVVFPGHVPDDVLPDLYRSATLLVYPSLYEGFGLPVLEAMASGVPVIASNAAALAEAAGDAALLVDPTRAEGLAEALAALLTDASLRARLSQRGLARSRDFTWERTACRTVEVYRRVGGGSRT